jgi:hypothetical protein
MLLELFLDLVGHGCLFGIAAKDDVGILCTGIISLTIQGGRIMKRKETFHQFLKQFLHWILQFHIENFNMTHLATADLMIQGILHGICMERHESDLDILDYA